MIGHIAYAEGAPCPTLVLAADNLPTEDRELVEVLSEARRWLCDNGASDVRKIALIALASHPLFDLDYRFVQVLDGDEPRFDLRGSCGHSILASVSVASRMGWMHPLAPSQRVRVNVLNNDENVVCEVDTSERDTNSFTVHFLHHPAVALASLLLDGSTVTELPYSKGVIRSSMVSAGNPYVFLDGRDLGRPDPASLFVDDPELFSDLVDIRRSAAGALDWDPDGAFPKVCAVVPGAQRVAVRAVSVPSWHPTLALTGATCLGAASAVEGTLPHRIAREAESSGDELAIDTPNGSTAVRVATSGTGPDDTLSFVSVSGKTVHFHGPVVVEPLRNLAFKEVEACLPLS